MQSVAYTCRFKTRKADLYEMMDCFRFRLAPGQYYVADNGSFFNDEEILLIGLHRFCCVGQLEVSMRAVFALHFSMLSRAFHMFVEHMPFHFKRLLFDNLEYWRPRKHKSNRRLNISVVGI